MSAMLLTDAQAQTRDRIADAAEALFRSIGYQKTTVADIARDCGMSPANVYRFFPSKSAINEAITRRLLDGLASEAEAIGAGKGSAAKRLRAVMRHLFERDIALFFAERRLHDMVTAAMTEHWGVIEIFVGRMLATWERLLEEGMRRGEFRRHDPANVARTLKHCLMLWHHPLLLADCLGRGQEAAQLAAELDRALDLILAGLAKAE